MYFSHIIGYSTRDAHLLLQMLLSQVDFGSFPSFFFFFLNTDPRPYHPLLAPYHFIVLITWFWSLSLSSCFRAHWWPGVWDSKREGKGNRNLYLTTPVPVHSTNHSSIYPFLSLLLSSLDAIPLCHHFIKILFLFVTMLEPHYCCWL